MLTESQYRTFDELLDSVRIDLRTYDLEGMFNPQELLKVAINVNYQLGLKINPTRSKMLEVVGGKVRLPNDFYRMNFALVCDGKRTVAEHVPTKTYTEGLLEGVQLSQAFDDNRNVRQYSTTLDINPGGNAVVHNLTTNNVIVQATLTDGSLVNFDVTIIDENTISIISTYNTTMPNVKIVVVGAKEAITTSAELVSNTSNETIVKYSNSNKRYEYHNIQPIHLERHKDISSDCFNLQCDSKFTGSLKNNFLITNFDNGELFINYQSLMEDDFGNLLVMDHPLVNEYYEYALKHRMLENMFLSGETQLLNPMQLMETRLRAARNNAVSFMNTPDFKEMKKMWELNRKAQYHNYYNMFKSTGR